MLSRWNENKIMPSELLPLRAITLVAGHSDNQLLGLLISALLQRPLLRLCT